MESYEPDEWELLAAAAAAAAAEKLLATAAMVKYIYVSVRAYIYFYQFLRIPFACLFVRRQPEVWRHVCIFVGLLLSTA